MAAPADDEPDCIERCRRGDPAAFASLVRSHQRMIHALAYRMTGSLADAEDLAQEAFVRAFDQLPAFRGDAKFSTWLYRIALHTCLNWRQREARRSQLHVAWASVSAAEGFAPEAGGEGDSATSHLVQSALLRLPAKQRAAIVLTVFDGLNHADAARALGCSEATVSWRVFAARTKLKRWLSRAQPAAHE
jgi:RNA polymerase sigma-70 factor (ECF subfamily)